MYVVFARLHAEKKSVKLGLCLKCMWQGLKRSLESMCE